MVVMVNYVRMLKLVHKNETFIVVLFIENEHSVFRLKDYAEFSVLFYNRMLCFGRSVSLQNR